MTFNNSLLLTLPNPADLNVEISPVLNEKLLDEEQDFTKEDLLDSHDIGGDTTDIESDVEEGNTNNGQKSLQIILPEKETKTSENIPR